jgi:hypothetical protein
VTETDSNPAIILYGPELTHMQYVKDMCLYRAKNYNAINILEAARGPINPSSNYGAKPNDHVLHIVLAASKRSSHYPQVTANIEHLHIIRAHN